MNSFPSSSLTLQEYHMGHYFDSSASDTLPWVHSCYANEEHRHDSITVCKLLELLQASVSLVLSRYCSANWLTSTPLGRTMGGNAAAGAVCLSELWDGTKSGKGPTLSRLSSVLSTTCLDSKNYAFFSLSTASKQSCMTTRRFTVTPP